MSLGFILRYIFGIISLFFSGMSLDLFSVPLYQIKSIVILLLLLYYYCDNNCADETEQCPVLQVITQCIVTRLELPNACFNQIQVGGAE